MTPPVGPFKGCCKLELLGARIRFHLFVLRRRVAPQAQAAPSAAWLGGQPSLCSATCASLAAPALARLPGHQGCNALLASSSCPAKLFLHFLFVKSLSRWLHCTPAPDAGLRQRSAGFATAGVTEDQLRWHDGTGDDLKPAQSSQSSVERNGPRLANNTKMRTETYNGLSLNGCG